MQVVFNCLQYSRGPLNRTQAQKSQVFWTTRIRNSAIMKFILLMSLVSVCSAMPHWYQNERNAFIEEENRMRLGKSLVLNHKEKKVNRHLMALKDTAVEESRFTLKLYPPSMSFFQGKALIDQSEIFKIIQLMPKGGALHVHYSAMTSLDWMIKNFTYDQELYSSTDADGIRQYRYITEPEQPPTGWTNVMQERNLSNNTEAFDTMLASELSIWVEHPHQAYPSVNAVWKKFQNYFVQSSGLTDPEENSLNMFDQMMLEFHEDNVQYMEIRSCLEGSSDFARKILERMNAFIKQHPTFVGVKFICSGHRTYDHAKQMKKVRAALKLMKEFPDLMKGFDLVNQEDTTHMTKYYADQLLYPQREHRILPYFFHSGETDWTNGVDENLVDAVLLNASRVGHGFAALKHPKVMEAVNSGQLVVELNPISNQVLGLVSDLRNHPGAVLFANNAPCVVSSDDPSVWYASPLSHDFYMAFMGLGSATDDLRLLKQLAINSFKYSTMTNEEKTRALKTWEHSWDKFIDDVIAKYNLDEN